MPDNNDSAGASGSPRDAASSAGSTDTETIDERLLRLDTEPTTTVIAELFAGHRRALEAIERAQSAIEKAVTEAHARLANGNGRLALVGAGASGRLAVQDGAELWPTFGWPHERLLLGMAGGTRALTESIEGVEDDALDARNRVCAAAIGAADVVLALAASGRSPWTCAWLETARQRGALAIGMANNANTRLLDAADCGILLDTGAEVLAGSTRMGAGTAQKIALNLFSTSLMIRLNRTYGNLMVDMAAVNCKLDDRRLRLLRGVLPDIDDTAAREALVAAEGWVKLAALVAKGQTTEAGRALLERHNGSLRAALAELT